MLCVKFTFRIGISFIGKLLTIDFELFLIEPFLLTRNSQGHVGLIYRQINSMGRHPRNSGRYWLTNLHYVPNSSVPLCLIKLLYSTKWATHLRYVSRDRHEFITNRCRAVNAYWIPFRFRLIQLKGRILHFYSENYMVSIL